MRNLTTIYSSGAGSGSYVPYATRCLAMASTPSATATTRAGIGTKRIRRINQEIVDAQSNDSLVVTAGFVGPGPHDFGRASNSAKNADTHLIIPTGVVQNLPTVLEAQEGQILPFDSTRLGGDDAFTLWTQR